MFHRSEKSIVGIYFIYWPVDEKLGGDYIRSYESINQFFRSFLEGAKEEYFIEENYSYPPSRYYKLREHFLLRVKKKKKEKNKKENKLLLSYKRTRLFLLS